MDGQIPAENTPLDAPRRVGQNHLGYASIHGCGRAPLDAEYLAGTANRHECPAGCIDCTHGGEMRKRVPGDARHREVHADTSEHLGIWAQCHGTSGTI